MSGFNVYYLAAICEVSNLLIPIFMCLYEWINEEKVKGYVHFRLL